MVPKRRLLALWRRGITQKETYYRNVIIYPNTRLSLNYKFLETSSKKKQKLNNLQISGMTEAFVLRYTTENNKNAYWEALLFRGQFCGTLWHYDRASGITSNAATFCSYL